jgi:hypothetical protein
MKSTQFLQNLCVYASVTAAAIVSAGCDSGNGGGGTSQTSSNPGDTSGAVMCPTNFCTLGGGGYAFSYADSDNEGAGTSTATLHSDGSLCIDGHVMALPPNPSQTDYSNDWGLGIGVNLNQPMGMGTTKMPFQLTGTGVTVNVNSIPACQMAAGMRVVVDQMGATPEYCAALTPSVLGKEIPWASFNTACWDGSGTSLTAAPNSDALKVQFVTGSTACDFKNFCITEATL